MTFPRRGEIYWVALDPVVGTEIAKTRPAVIISNDIGMLTPERMRDVDEAIRRSLAA